MLVWNIDGIYITSITTNRWDGQQLFTSGIGWISKRKTDDISVRDPFHYEATVTPLGWYITILNGSTRIGEVQGATFNLPLEIAAAARRLL